MNMSSLNRVVHNPPEDRVGPLHCDAADALSDDIKQGKGAETGRNGCQQSGVSFARRFLAQVVVTEGPSRPVLQRWSRDSVWRRDNHL